MDTLSLFAVLAILLVLVFDCSNGFHDAANIIATVIASRAMTPMTAVLIVGVFVLAFLTFFGVPFVSVAPHKGAV